MDHDRFLTAKACQPAETISQWSTRLSWFFDVLMEALQGSDCKVVRHHLLRLAHDLLFERAVAVQCDQEWRGRVRSGLQIVIKIDAGVESAIGYQFVIGHWRIFCAEFPQRRKGAK